MVNVVGAEHLAAGGTAGSNSQVVLVGGARGHPSAMCCRQLTCDNLHAAVAMSKAASWPLCLHCSVLRSEPSAMAGAVLQEGRQTLRQLDVTQSSQATQGGEPSGAGAAAAAWRACRYNSQVSSSLHVLLQLLCWLLLSLRQGWWCCRLAMQVLAVLISDE